MAFGDSDLPAIFSDFGVPVTWNGVTATGILDVYEDVFHHGDGPGGFQTNEFLLRVPQPALRGTPKAFDAITIPWSANLPPGFVPGVYIVKSLPQCHDPSIVDMTLKGPAPS
jgi:hypothetical protein